VDLNEFKKEYVRNELGVSEDFADIFTFIDFGNVNHWFDEDNQDWDNRALSGDEKLSIDLSKLKDFTSLFSKRTRIYYGSDPKNKKSLSFSYVLRKIFGKRDFIEKDLQKIKHYIEPEEKEKLKLIETDKDGKSYVEIRKSNFDVEISVDAIKMLEHYDTFCLFSGDADFVYLNNFLKKKGKKVILFKAGYITSKLRKSADLLINAQKIKRHIAKIQTKT
jgi:uncharacterized LabA/DUF88 family protein